MSVYVSQRSSRETNSLCDFVADVHHHKDTVSALLNRFHLAELIVYVFNHDIFGKVDYYNIYPLTLKHVDYFVQHKHSLWVVFLLFADLRAPF